jgi:hypothetical protein
MSYSVKTLKSVDAARRTVGNQLGRWAVHLDFPVSQVSEITGASRQTVYNWFTGVSDVNNAYRPIVERLLAILIKAKDKDQAWSKACQEFNSRP